MKRIIALALVLMMVIPAVMSCSKKDTITLNVLNWGDYMDPDVVKEFEKENPGIKINLTTTTSNEEMYTICSTEGSKVDILFPSDYMVERMIKEGLLAELDLANIPNFKYIEEASSTRTYDPESKYSIPYVMGTVGIVYNKTLVKEPVTSWGILWDEKYSQNIMMYDSIRDSLMVALAYLGYDINTTNLDELKEAGELLKKQKPLVVAYGNDNIKFDMISGSVALAVDYSGTVAEAIIENPDLGYVVPDEGSNVWVDNIVIMKNCEYKEAAEKFLDFLCVPEIAAKNTEYLAYTTPNVGAIELLDDELLNNEAYLITPEQLARCKYFVDLDKDTLTEWNNVWMEVKTYKAEN